MDFDDIEFDDRAQSLRNQSKNNSSSFFLSLTKIIDFSLC